MATRWLVVLASLTLVAGGTFSAWETAACPPLSLSDGCLTPRAYQELWSGALPIGSYSDAVLRDPASPYRWCDLGEALLASGDNARATICLNRGLALGPNVPAILLRTINAATITRSKEDALFAAGRLLDALPGTYDDIVFAQLARTGCDTNDIEEGILARHPNLCGRYLSRLMSSGDADGAASVWIWMQAHGRGDPDTEREYRMFEALHRSSGRGAPQP